MAKDSVLPLVTLVVVAGVLIGLAYANVTGMLQLSGAELVDSTTASIVVAVLFLLTIPWVYRRAKAS